MTKRNKIIYWVSTIWLALGMLSTGIVQLVKAKEGPGGVDMITHLGYPVYLLTLLTISKMSGAIYSHIATGDAMNELFPSLLLLLLALISWYFRPVERKIILGT